MNPILPRNHFVPDAEARVMPDGRLYIYGSYDISGNRGYCSKIHHCFSTDDMLTWREEGIIFRNDENCSMFPAHPNTVLFAPDAIYKDGKYYLFICCPGDFEGVASADSPAGPFSDAVPVKGADGLGIDPSVFVDDDGTAYYFWGQFQLRGGVLTDDMTALIPETVTDHIITEAEHGFHEGASIRKYNGRYYMLYTDISRGKATCISYAVSDHPLGPYTKGGVIIDNYGCDAKSWNNHGSMECFHGQWYVFYHRSSQNSDNSRRVCVEPIYFDENGHIPEVKQSVNGAAAPLDVKQGIDASVASKLSANSYVAPIDHGEAAFLIPSFYGAWAEYRTLDFGTGVSKLQVKVKGQGKLQAKIENTLLGEISVDCTEYTTVSLPVKPVSGVHTFWFWTDAAMLEIDSFVFE